MDGVGIDLGTSFTAAAIAREGTVDMVRLGEQATVIPSVAFLDDDGDLLTGEPADRLGLATPDRVAREFKRRMGDPTPLVLGGTQHSPSTLTAALLRDVLATVQRAQSDEPPRRIVLTHPAVWGPYRREQFAAVPHLLGLDHPDSATTPGSADPTVRLVTEPVAAATHFCANHPLPADGLLAVYDLGGGTFDSAVVRNGVDELEIVGTPEGVEWLGGADFDRSVVEYVDRQLAGAVSALDPAEPHAAEVLIDIRRQCLLAKESLSTRTQTSIAVRLPDGTHEITLDRSTFARMITPTLETTIEAFRRTLSASGVTPQDLDAVLLVGGSSQIPLVSKLLREALQRPIMINAHPKHAVALGAALLSTRPSAGIASSRQRPPATSVSAPAPPPVSTPAQALAPAPAQTLVGGSGVPRRRQRHRRDSRRAGIAARVGGTRGWLALATAVAVIVAVGAATMVWLNDSGSPSAPAAAHSSPTTSSHPSPMTSRGGTRPGEMILFNGELAGAFELFASSAEDDWRGHPPSPSTAAAGKAVSVAVAAAQDRGGAELRARWSGSGPGQIYLQTPATTRDVSAYGRSATALTFEVMVRTRPTAQTTLEVHCQFPCAGEVQATSLFRSLPVGQRTTVRVPLQCFVDSGLDLGHVDTFFLVATSGRFDASFSDIRWVPGAADLPETPACNDLT